MTINITKEKANDRCRNGSRIQKKTSVSNMGKSGCIS